MNDLVERLRNVTEDDAYALPWTFGETCREAATEIEALRRENQELRSAVVGGATPEQIAAAWGAWRVRHKGSMGPGPGFVEAINAALAVSPAIRVLTLSDIHAHYTKPGENYNPAESFIDSETAMSDIHREQLDRPRIKPADRSSEE